MLKKSFSYSFYSILLFLIWPFLTLLISIKNFKLNWSKNILWLFIIFYGFTFVISNEGMDANRYKDELIESNINGYAFRDFFQTLYAEGTNNVDILKPLIIYIVSIFTNNYHILFGVFGILFGYFYSRNIWYLFDRSSPSLKIINIPIIFTFAVVIGFWQINGFRFFFAAHVFLFGVLPFLREGNKKYLWISFLTFIIHFSMIFPIIILIIYFLIGNYLRIYFYIFLISFFVSELDLEVLNNTFNYLPYVFEYRTSSYLSEEYRASRIDKVINNAWYALYYRKLLNWVVVSLIIMIYLRAKDIIKGNTKLINLLNFSLLIYSFANFVSSVPSAGRFYGLANLFMLAFIFFYWQDVKVDNFSSFFLILSLPFLLIFNLVTIRIGFDSINTLVLYTNPVVAFFIESDVPLIDWIK